MDLCKTFDRSQGTGQLAVQMAKLKGFNVIGTCSPGKSAIAQACGVDQLIDYTVKDIDIAERVKDITSGEGVKCVIDGVGKTTADASINSLGRRGICIFFGNASGAVPPIDPLRLIGNSNFITRPKLLDYTASREELLMRAKDVFEWIANGDLAVSIDREFKLEEASDAHRYIEAGKTAGKILLNTS